MIRQSACVGWNVHLGPVPTTIQGERPFVRLEIRITISSLRVPDLTLCHREPDADAKLAFREVKVCLVVILLVPGYLGVHDCHVAISEP